ncbi:hypothetical protein [Yoonia sp.]|uniref:hypothetical protein n=1 Tax=Yoonia sp. TaxID=2212373 RepID=UPI00391CA73A
MTLFRRSASVTALGCLALCGMLFVNGGQYAATFGIAPDQGAGFVARRAAPVFAGLAVMLWLLRDLPKGSARDGLCIGMVVLWWGIAASGIAEYVTGQAGSTILIAAMVEVIVGLVFVIARRR